MIRRNFLRRSIATVAGAGMALSGVPAVIAATTNPSTTNPPPTNPLQPNTWSTSVSTFSIDVVADDPTGVLNELGQFLSLHRLSTGSIKVQMAQLAGTHISDAVFVRNSELVDFRNQDGIVEGFLNGLSMRNAFVRPVVDPTLIRFSGGDGSSEVFASTAELYVGSVLVGRRKLGVEAFEETIGSSRGSAVVRYDRKGVRIVEASCKHKTCVGAGTITNTGESIVCIPGRIQIVLTGGGLLPGGVHAVTQ